MKHPVDHCLQDTINHDCCLIKNRSISRGSCGFRSDLK
nr:MAG TPA: hypothetical protein [Caudoviricetes sp.]